MRIDSNPGAQPLPAATGSGNPTTAAAEARSSPSSGTLGEDQAQLSGVHVQIQALVAQVAQLPEINQEKVNALRQSVVAGTYRASPERIADAMFSDMVEPIAA
ncbi:MAG: flagellar biosynthesis anti-sigma factor FlgM [Candidatus Sulfotelmatobacter sp.]